MMMMMMMMMMNDPIQISKNICNALSNRNNKQMSTNDKKLHLDRLISLTIYPITSIYDKIQNDVNKCLMFKKRYQ